MAPVVISYPEAGEELMRGYLDSLDPVSRWRAAQLRDVFSLAHVGDWGEEEDGSAAPVSPPRPSSGEDPFVIEVVSSHRSYIRPRSGFSKVTRE